MQPTEPMQLGQTNPCGKASEGEIVLFLWQSSAAISTLLLEAIDQGTTTDSVGGVFQYTHSVELIALHVSTTHQE